MIGKHQKTNSFLLLYQSILTAFLPLLLIGPLNLLTVSSMDVLQEKAQLAVFSCFEVREVDKIQISRLAMMMTISGVAISACFSSSISGM